MSDRGDTSRDVLLRVRVENLSTAGFKAVADGVKLITAALDGQIAAANRAEIKERELAASLTKLDQAARNLVSLDALIGRYRNFDDVLARSEARVEASRQKLTAFRQSLEATGDTSTKAANSLKRLVDTHASAEASLASEKAAYDRLGEALRKAGIDTTNLAQAERDLNAVAQQTGQARTRLSAAITDLAQNQRLAKDAATAERAEQEKLTTSLRAQADARAKLAAEGQRQYQDALRRNTETAAVQKREYDAAVATTKARVEAETARVAAERVPIDSAMARAQTFKTENLTRIKAERDAEAAAAAYRQKAANDQVVAERAKHEAMLASVRKFNDETRVLTARRVADETKAARDTVDALRKTNQETVKLTATPARGTAAAGGGILGTGSARGEAASIGALGLRPYELTNLGYQINDVITGLASGQNMTQILAQQGGQFIQIFGRAALHWFPLVAVAVAGVTVAISALTSNLRTAASNREFAALMTANKYAADQNVGSLTALRKELNNLGVSWDDAGKAIKTALEANIRPEKMREVTLAANAMSFVTGKTVPEAMKDLTTGISGGIDAFDKLIAVYPAIGKENAEYIRGLFLAGKEQEAQIEILRRLGEEYEKARKDKLSKLDEAVIKLRTSWNNFIDSLGKSSAFDSLLTKVTGLVDSLTKAVDWIDRFVAKLDDPRFQTFLTVLEKISNFSPPKRVLDTITGAVSGAADYLAPAPAPATKAPAPATKAPGEAAYSAIPPATSGGAERLTIKPGTILDSEDLRQLKEIISAATKSLPEGYRAEITSGRAPRASGTRNHPEGNAIDVKLIDKDGNTVPGFMGKDSTGQYTAFATVALAETKRLQPERAAEFESGTQYGAQDSGHFGFRAEGARGSRGPLADTGAGGVTSGPTPAQTNAAAAAERSAERQLELARSASVEEDIRIKRQERRLQLQEEGITGERASGIINKEIATFQEGKDREKYSRDQERSKQNEKDKLDALDLAAIQVGGQKAVNEAIAAGRTNYEELNAIRKTGEAEARQDQQKRKQEQDQLDTAEKRVGELRRQNLNQHKSSLDQINEATNIRYDNEIKQLDKLAERSSTISKDKIAALKAEAEELRKIELGQNVSKAAETQAKEATATRRALVQSYTNLEASGDITISEKENKIKEAFALTNEEIVKATAAMEAFLQSAAGLALPPTQIALMTAKIAEFRSEAKYVDPFFKGLKDTLSSSFSSGLSTAFDTVAEAIGGVVAKTKEWKDVWTSVKNAALNFFATILKELATYILKAELAKLASSFLGGGGGGGGGILSGLGSLFGGGTAFAGTTTAGSAFIPLGGGSFAVFHEGGIVGHTPAPRRSVDASWFTNAPRYHSGNVVGLAPDEQAAILQRGEEVLSRDNPRNLINRAANSFMEKGQTDSFKELAIRNVLVMDEGQIPAAMASAHGERVTISHIVKNAATIRQLLK